MGEMLSLMGEVPLLGGVKSLTGEVLFLMREELGRSERQQHLHSRVSRLMQQRQAADKAARYPLFKVPWILPFEPSLEAFDLRSDLISSIKILSQPYPPSPQKAASFSIWLMQQRQAADKAARYSLQPPSSTSHTKAATLPVKGLRCKVNICVGCN